MVVMLFFMFAYENHSKAPQIIEGLSLENLIMFCLATPVQVCLSKTQKSICSIFKN